MHSHLINNSSRISFKRVSIDAVKTSFLYFGVAEKDKHIIELKNLLETALKQNRFYVQTYQETRNIEVQQGGYRETSVNEVNYRETSINEGNYQETSVNVNDRGSYVEGDSYHNSPE
ncbi:hypothetical protein [Okeania sp. SIO3B5]|uniref:hypothetical protein n=1 Tax=Okeania sp. SIO3B5 TaxID=2607811 RepID=UPI0035C8AD79